MLKAAELPREAAVLEAPFSELKRRVDNGEMRMALALYPVSMQQIMDIADSGKIMPPKATWFEPKLRSGLVIHKLQ